jgi:PAS domain-containing protein
MSDLSDFENRPLSPGSLAELRRRAASRLTGAAVTKGSAARAADALAVLHDLASSPATAAEALTLLHELQVLQVEIDLQAQELRESRADLEAALRRQVELYDHQPAGCFVVDARLKLVELNFTGAEMLGVSRAQAIGLPLDSFFSAGSQPVLRSALAGLAAGHAGPSFALELNSRNGDALSVVARLANDTAIGRRIVNLLPACPDAALPGDQRA